VAKVLVIEDDAGIREILVEVLEREGYSVSSAEHGLAGLARAREHHPDLILLDLMMPVMDGWTFLAAQIEDPRIAHIPVVILSAAKDLSEVRAAQCLSKPCNVSELLATVERYRLRRDRNAPPTP
jgi:CheY-like chemotaxis protein